MLVPMPFVFYSQYLKSLKHLTSLETVVAFLVGNYLESNCIQMRVTLPLLRIFTPPNKEKHLPLKIRTRPLKMEVSP